MNFKGTKGHWRINQFNGKGSCIDIIPADGDVNLTAQIAQVYSRVETDYKTPHTEELKANAQLMATSPKMLETLEELANCKGIDYIINHYPELASKLSQVIEEAKTIKP